jgi:hypothetical protein
MAGKPDFLFRNLSIGADRDLCRFPYPYTCLPSPLPANSPVVKIIATLEIFRGARTFARARQCGQKMK